MSKPWKHALSSARKFGGVPGDYIKIHDWFDQTKMCVPDVRHRAILHSAFGIFLCEQVFGHNIKNSDGKNVSVRDIGEQHCLEDLGTIPTMQDWLKDLPIKSWMSKPDKSVENIESETVRKDVLPFNNRKVDFLPQENEQHTKPWFPNAGDIRD